MRRGVKSLLKVQNKRVNLSSFVQDFYPIIYYSGQLSFTTVPFPKCMLPVGQELIFIQVSHDICAYYMFKQLTCCGYSRGSFLISPGKRVVDAYFFMKTDVVSVHVVFLFFYKNISCKYSLEGPCQGISNEYPQHMFLQRINPSPAELGYFLPLQTVLLKPTDLDLHCLPLSM